MPGHGDGPLHDRYYGEHILRQRQKTGRSNRHSPYTVKLKPIQARHLVILARRPRWQGRRVQDQLNWPMVACAIDSHRCRGETSPGCR
jgi:hypothetical protein